MKYEPFSVKRIADVIGLAMKMQQESDFKTVPFDVDQIANSIMRMVVDNPRGFGVVAYTDDGQPVGMLAGGLSYYMFSRGSVANDYAWFVLPEHRGSRAALKMLNMFKSWARDNGATELYIGITSDITKDRTGQMLERIGFDHVGGNYRAKLNG
jgi:GNAT superfamily N-acetyltransferase